MSAGYLGKQTNWSDESDAAARNDERLNTWGEIPGRIVSFDAARQTARVQPLYRPKFNGQPVDMPELLDVPVRFARAGNGALTFPVSAGDRVTLRPQMRSSELYHAEDDGAPSDARSFHLADMEAHLDGGESLLDPIQAFDGANVHLRFNPAGTYGLRGSETGKVSIEGAQGNIYDLIVQAIEKEAEVFTLLGTESLVHAVTYAQRGAELVVIANKLRGMAL